MKNYIIITLLLLITIIYAQELIPVIENYSNGNIYSITYHKTTLYGTIGEIHGLRTWLYDNEQIKIESHYKNGKKDGLWIHWYENGQKKNEGNFKNDIKDGLWTFWYEDGQTEMEVTYKHGKIISRVCWDDYGKKIGCN